jgi:hypothetical protein
MPALNFKSQFAQLVADGRKQCTIRRSPAPIGATVYLFTGMRTNACKRLGSGTACGDPYGGPKEGMSANPTLALCDLAKPHLIEGACLFASKSVVVAVNHSQPLADHLADIKLTVDLLTVLAEQLAK